MMIQTNELIPIDSNQNIVEEEAAKSLISPDAKINLCQLLWIFAGKLIYSCPCMYEEKNISKIHKCRHDLNVPE